MKPDLAQALLTLALVVIFGGFFIWGIRTGQFRDIEQPKYRIFDDQDENDAGIGKGKQKEDSK